MNGFINHMLNRHLVTEPLVMPQLPSRFEPSANAAVAMPVANETFAEAVPLHTAQATQTAFSEANRHAEPVIANRVLNTERNIHTTEYMYEKYEANALRNTIVADDSTSQNERQAFNSINANIEMHATADPRPQSLHTVIENTQPLLQDPIAQTKDKRNYAGEVEQPRKTAKPAATIAPVIAPVWGFGKNTNMATGLFHSTTEAPIIKISIGRIEIKAVQAASPAKIARTENARPKMSLEDYLNKRNSSR